MLSRKKIKEKKIHRHYITSIQKILIFMLVFSSFAYTNEGPVGAKAVVSSKSILNGNIVQLHIRATGNMATFRKVNTIDGIKVLSQKERITHRHVYNNGELKRECTIFTLTFAPEKDMMIPSFEVKIDGKIYRTEPIQLRMKDATASNKLKSNIFSLKLHTNRKSVTVGEAFLATVTLSLQHKFIISRKLQYFRPKFEGFFVEQLGEGKSYDKGDYQVTELHYILTPHTEGNYTLGPAYAIIGLQDKNKKTMVNVDKSRKIFQRASNTLGLKVLPQASESDLVGTFTLKSNIDRQKAEAGKPVKLSIKFEGEGDLTHFEFPDYLLDGVTVYSDPAKVEIKEANGNIRSSYSREFVFISQESFTVPERRFSMLNPKTGELKELEIEEITVEIEQPETSTETSKTSQAKVEKERERLPLKEKAEAILSYWWMTIVAFLLGGLFFYLLRYLSVHRRRSYTEEEALKILLPHTSKDAEVEEMVQRLYAKINGDSTVKIDKRELKILLERYK